MIQKYLPAKKMGIIASDSLKIVRMITDHLRLGFGMDSLISRSTEKHTRHTIMEDHCKLKIFSHGF